MTSSGEIVALHERVRALELRLDRLEKAGPAGAAAEAPAMPATIEAAADAGGTIDTETTAATIFTRVAMLCFVLLGALVLRVLTQQHILGAGFGTVLGFVYAGHLIVLSFLPGRCGRLARETSLFQCSGAVLACFIGIESALRTHTMSRPAAMVTIAAFALLALATGVAHRKPSLAGTGILGGMLALVALDMQDGDVTLQMALVALLGALGIASSWRAGWGRLRAPVLLLLLALYPAGLLLRGREPVLAAGLLSSSAAVWTAVMLQHLIAFRRLRRAAIWLPLFTLWFAGILQLAHGRAGSMVIAGIALFALACVAVCSRRMPEALAGLAGMMATAALAGALGWPLLDSSGLLCAAGGAALWYAGREAAEKWASLFATMLMLAGAVVGLLQLLRPPVPTSGMIAMPASALILVCHYVLNSRNGRKSHAGIVMQLTSIALAAGLVLLMGFFAEVLDRRFDQPARLLLSQTAVLVATALVLTSWGHVSHRRAPLFCGLACMAFALAKMLLVDLVRLKSLNMLVSLVLVGLASVAISVILRRRR